MPLFTHALQYKSPLERGTDVLHAQRALGAAGFLKGDADGLFGAQTAAAVKEFQTARQLPVNGTIDAKTWHELFWVTSPSSADLPVEALLGLLGVSHQFKDSVSWRLTENGVAIDGDPATGTAGRAITVERILDEFGSHIDGACAEFKVPKELIVATIATESGGNATARREEPGFVSDADTPGRVSVGLMQTLISTAQGQMPRDTVTAEWLRIPQNSIRAGASYIASQKQVTQFDPPKVACAYNAGGLYHEPSAANRWRMRQYPIGTSAHADRFVAFFNDCIFTLGHRATPATEYSFASAFKKQKTTTTQDNGAATMNSGGEDVCVKYMEENPEIATGEVRVPRGANFVLRVFAGGGTLSVAAHVRAMGAPVAQSVGLLRDLKEVPQTLDLAQVSAQPAGTYVLTWSPDGLVDDWKVVSELVVDGAMRYRRMFQRVAAGVNTEMMFVTVA